MRLAVDASTLIAEVLRARGRKLLGHADLDLVLATETWEETEHELRKRTILLAQRGSLSEARAAQLLAEALALIAARVTLVPPDLYVGQVAEAQRRILRDPRDAPTVALALTLDCGIWTGDYDFFGCGLPVWTTETLQLHLTHLAARPGA
jgi:predicted nucleic acid-binding protein